MKENKFTYEDVFNALNSMDTEKGAFLLENITVSMLYTLNSEESFDYVIKEIDNCIAQWQLLEAYLVELKTKLVTGEYNVTGVINKETVSEKYDCLEEAEKKEVVLELINNPDFQKKICQIMSDELKKVIKSDNTMKALDQLLGFSKYIDELIEQGIGCNHKYGVKS